MVIALSLILIPFALIHPGVLHFSHKIAFMIMAKCFMATKIKNVYVKLLLVYISVWEVAFLINKTYIEKVYSQHTTTLLSIGFLYFIAGVVFYVVSESKRDPEFFYNAICIAALAQVTLCIFQLFRVDPMVMLLKSLIETKQLYGKFDTVGSLVNRNFIGAYLAISLPFFFRKKWCYFLPAVILILFCTKSFFAVGAAAVALFVYFKKWYLVPGGLMAVILYEKFIDSNILLNELNFKNKGTRLYDYIKTYQGAEWGFFDYIFGQGAGYSVLKYPLHSDIITIFFWFGILGLILSFGFIRSIISSNKILMASMCAALFNMSGNYPASLAPIAFLILIVFGLMEKERLYGKY